jgi:hypothetical protein
MFSNGRLVSFMRLNINMTNPKCFLYRHYIFYCRDSSYCISNLNGSFTTNFNDLPVFTVQCTSVQFFYFVFETLYDQFKGRDQ